jgi:hypothetical protein
MKRRTLMILLFAGLVCTLSKPRAHPISSFFHPAPSLSGLLSNKSNNWFEERLVTRSIGET